MIKPKILYPGDKVAAVSLSWGGPSVFPYRYRAGVEQLEKTFDLKVVEMPHTLKDAEWLFNNPKARAEDLMQAFADPDIKGIISTIGGDDSIRLLPYLDLDVIRSNPKIFMGYSDTTIAHMACFKAGLVSFYGPSIMAGFAENTGIFPYMQNEIQRTVFSSKPVGIVEPNQDGWTVEHLDWADESNQQIKRKLLPSGDWQYLQGEGVHHGHLIGGCVEVLDWLRGTDYWPEKALWENAILFLETSEEGPSPEELKRYLRTYAAMGVLELLTGLLIGRPGGNIDPAAFPQYDQDVLDVVNGENGLDELPIITRMDFGHTDPMMILPIGVQAKIDCDLKQFAILENSVSA